MATAVEMLQAPLKGRVPSRDKVSPSMPEFEVSSVKLVSKSRTADIGGAITGGEIERTIEGASVLTFDVNDTGGKLLNGKMMLAKDPVDVKVGKFWFRLVRTSKQGDTLTLTFEDREVSLMRGVTKPRRAYRDKITRAEFVLSMLRETVGDNGRKLTIPYYIPELHEKQDIGSIKKATSRKSESKDKAKPTIDRGLSGSDNVKMKGVRATPAQMRQAERALNVATALRAPEQAILAMLCAGIGESEFKAIMNLGGSPYGGVFQGNVRAGVFKIDDTEGMAKSFLQGGKGFQGGGAIKLAKGRMNEGDIATTVEASGKPGSFYGAYLGEAKAILKAYGGADAGGGAATADRTVTVIKRYAFARGSAKKKESSWAAAQRLAEEVQWRAFMNEGRFYFVSEQALYLAKPKLVLSEASPGVSAIDFDYDRNIAVSEATVSCRADMWVADPGSVVTLEKVGRASGKWLVSSMRRGVYDRETTVTLKQPMKEKAEPAPETDTKTIPGKNAGRGSSAGSGSGEPGKITGSPKNVIDTVVIPIARKHNIDVTPGSVAAANARHGPTNSGGTSDHQGPPDRAWAADMSNGGQPTPQMTALARELSEVFSLQWSGAGAVSGSMKGYRYQMIYKSNIGGNHFNHVHFGIRRA